MFEDSFANEIYMKFVDDSGEHIDLFSEIEQNYNKMSEDEFQFVNVKSDPYNINVTDDFVTSTISPDEDVKNNSFIPQIDQNQELMMEFNSILDAVSNAELTPPQTPPPEIFQQIPEVIEMEYQQIHIPASQYEIFDYQTQSPVPEQFVLVQNTSFPQTSAFYEESNGESEITFDPDSIISSPADIQRELEVVDEIVRAHSQNNSDFDDNASQYSSSSSAWSPRSEISSSSSFNGDNEPRVKKSHSRLNGVNKKRPRAYGRNPDEKKSRKKEQNKNAATRYRQKKKVEIEIILDDEKLLAEKNRKLMSIYKETRREVKYLKSLLRDLFKARGFI